MEIPVPQNPQQTFPSDTDKQKYIGIRRFFTLRLNLFRSGYVL